jgi:membrane protein YqaA with SNARE-associated domain
MSTLLILFFVVLLLNVIPAFAPPTWMVLSFLGFRLPSQMGWTFALTGAAAAATGRFLLGKFSRRILRKRWLSVTMQENINSIKFELERRPKLTFAVLLFYAFTPLPSNYLFIAYGLTTLPFIRIVAPFFLGRFVSYCFWTMSSAAVSRRLELEDTEAMAYFSVYFVLTQLALLGLVYVFARVDWHYLLQRGKYRWLPKSPSSAKGSP